MVEHAKLTGMQPLWAVTPLRGQNDSPEDAAALADLAKRFEALTDGIRPRISVIPYNCAYFAVPPAAAARGAFCELLRALVDRGAEGDGTA